MSERWIDRVEAAVDAYRNQCYQRLYRDTQDRVDATRAALLALVTEGRCLECGGTFADDGENEYHEECWDCGWAPTEPLDSADDRSGGDDGRG